jgi:hypothetical protein
MIDDYKIKSVAASLMASTAVTPLAIASTGVQDTVQSVSGTVRSASNRARAPKEAGIPMSIDERLIDLKLEAAEARNDAKFSAVVAELKVISSSLSGLKDELGLVKSTAQSTKTTVIGTGIAVVALIVAVVAFGGQMFSLALNLFEAGSSAAG